ncbi:MAG TPA: hypothetical protein VG269_21570 [Tepidisphaeraceae bacterium]|jgi:hypothetical protein|nr:hypothetical protein [Tepidisphaeraceae bacterium]
MAIARSFPRLFPILLITAPLLCCGCESLTRGRAQKVDLSTPKSAALDYLKAVQRGDAATAKAASMGTAEQLRWVDGLAGMVGGMRKFDAALFAKFGPVIGQAHVDMHDALHALADEPVELVEQGSEIIDGEEAKIDFPRKGFTAHSQPVYRLGHGKEGWKMNLPATYAPYPPQQLPMRLPEVTASFRRYEEIGGAFRASAADVMANRFHSPEEAERALGERIRELMKNASR